MEQGGESALHKRVIQQSIERMAENADRPSMSSHEFSAFVSLIEEEKRRSSEDERDGQMVSRMFTKHLTLGNILAVATSIGSAFALYYGIKDDLKDLHNSVNTHTEMFKTMTDDIAKNRMKYLPMVEDNKNDNIRQDQGMQAMRESILQLRDSVADLAKMSRETHEDMAVVKSRLEPRGTFPNSR